MRFLSFQSLCHSSVILHLLCYSFQPCPISDLGQGSDLNRLNKTGAHLSSGSSSQWGPTSDFLTAYLKKKKKNKKKKLHSIAFILPSNVLFLHRSRANTAVKMAWRTTKKTGSLQRFLDFNLDVAICVLRKHFLCH